MQEFPRGGRSVGDVIFLYVILKFVVVLGGAGVFLVGEEGLVSEKGATEGSEM